MPAFSSDGRNAPRKRLGFRRASGDSDVCCKTLTSWPARRNAGSRILNAIRRQRRHNPIDGDPVMADHRNDSSSVPLFPRARRSLFSARKIALMASVVAGLGLAVYGFDSLPGGFNILASPAHAQVSSDTSKVAQPIGFADIVHFGQSHDEGESHRFGRPQ